MAVVQRVTFGEKTIVLEFNKFAKQARGAVMVTCGETQVLVVVTGADEAKPGQDFFPLTVDYIEKFYAAGRIPGNYFKREGMLSVHETLTSRLIDRSIRPLFPENYRSDTFVTCTVMSLDPLHHPAPLALLGASAALMVSDIPFNGPVAGLRLGMDDQGSFIIDPNPQMLSRLELTMAATPDSVTMIEAGADFLGEEEMLSAIAFAREAMKPLFEAQLSQQAATGVAKQILADESPIPDEAVRLATAKIEAIGSAFKSVTKQERTQALKRVENEIVSEYLLSSPQADKGDAKKAFNVVKSDYLRSVIMSKGERADGRGLDEVRQLTCEVGLLHRTHGSALFQRGETQALGTVTLGVSRDEQQIDSVVLGDTSKRFMLHYNFPPFSVGEARALRSVGRREIGHGTLAERALERVMPTQDRFDYTVRLVSEVLEADGSSSMATVCAGALALLNAGVPLRELVAGVAMGLVIADRRHCILTDINDEEDHLGDMDFKVCGGIEGITALQMDNKVGGLSESILAEALAQAKRGRQTILAAMNATITGPGALKDTAPRVVKLKVSPDRIRGLIGPGGKMIRSIQDKFSVRVSVEDDGSVTITAADGITATAAEEMVRAAVTDPKPGDVFTGIVRKIMDFGAFIEIKPGTDGLCHISELAHHRVAKVEDVVREGEEVRVKVLEVDRMGKIKLSRKELLER